MSDKMLKSRLFFGLIVGFLLVILPSVLAQDTYLFLDVYIFPDGSALLEGESNLDIDIPDVEIKDGIIYGWTQKLTKKEGDTWSFLLDIQTNYSSFDVRIFLPESAELLVNSLEASTDPMTTSMDNMIVLELMDFDNPVYASFDYKLANVFPAKNGFDFWIIGIVLFVFMFSLYIIYNTRQKKKHQLQERLDKILPTLNEREEKILKSLLELGGKAKQRQLQKFTGIPKASFSRHVSTLERKKLVSKRKLGNTNLIEINEEFLKNL